VQLERPRGWTRDVQKGIELLVVVEHVHEGNLSFRFKPLRQLQVLLDAQVPCSSRAVHGTVRYLRSCCRYRVSEDDELMLSTP